MEARLAAQDTAVGARVILTPPGPTYRVSMVLALVNICPQSHERRQEWSGHCSGPTFPVSPGHAPQPLGSLISSKLL